MTRLLRVVRTSVFAIATAGLLASCHDEGGVLDVYFGARGSGSCDSISVVIDLAAADALLAPGFTDEQDCSLPQILEDSGCDLSVELLNGGARARVTVSGCGELPATESLFRCGFSDGTLEDISFTSKGACDCTTAACDSTPPLCINDNPLLSGCERCSNGTDDDNNGSVDCEDPACENAPACNDSTTTSSSSTSVTDGPSSTTSSTIPTEPVQKYAVTYSIDDGQNIGALQFDIGYGNAVLRARSVISDPECRKLVSSAFASFDYDTVAQTVHVSMSNLTGTAGLTELVECSFATDAEPAANDFSLHVAAALNLQGQPIASPPPVKVGDVVPVTTTTTDGGVTTTLQITTTTDDGVTTTTIPETGDPFLVTFRLTSASVADVASVQLSSDYSGANGKFRGHGPNVSCTDLVSGTLYALNDQDTVCSLEQDKACQSNSQCTSGQGTCSVTRNELVIGMISYSHFSAPIDLMVCEFLGEYSDPPTASDFPIVIEDATDEAGDPISIAVAARVEPKP